MHCLDRRLVTRSTAPSLWTERLGSFVDHLPTSQQWLVFARMSLRRRNESNIAVQVLWVYG